MHPKFSVFIATSLDGFIARENGSIDWLMKANELAPAGEDCGYKSFIGTVDMLIMGRYSYETVLSFDQWPYTQLPVIVMSKNQLNIPEHLSGMVSVTGKKPDELVHELACQGIKHVYIDGGITIQNFLTNNLVDEITITIIPVLLGSGRSLFGPLKDDIELQHIATTTFDGGFVQLKYKVGE